ncbi:beta-lactamase-like protein [Xylogone sp. PMI_703]|nr:beta-lactamase-like protein [Xylogone sp. PMI_703]
MFTFTSLQGAQSESSASQSLLELDGGVKILIDVGWDESFDVSKLKELEKQVPTLSIILLTHPTVSHLAAFAHCCKHFPLFTRIPIYATTPVISLGRTLLQDLYSSTPLASTIIPPAALSEGSYSYSQSISASKDPHILLQPPTNEEIASYFSLIHPLKYSQPHQPLPSPFSPPLNGLTITAYNAGHTLGGTIWHIQHGLESIVYAVDWNQARENVLAGAAWLGGAGAGGAEVIEQLRKPTALICSSRGSDNVALAGGRAKRDELLLDMIRSAVTKGGIVLIPTDSSARVLELAYLLEHAWRVEDKGDPPLRAANLYLASKNIHATMRYARSMLEWMDDGIIREFEAHASGQQKQANGEPESRQYSGAGPFDFKYLRLLERKSQIERVLSNEKTLDGKPIGKVILASDTSLEWGFSKEVLKKIAADSRNLVILTERMSKGDSGDLSNRLARTLWSWWEERRDGVALEPGRNGENLEQVYGGGREIELKDSKRIPLEGSDLAIYQQWLATQRQLQTTLQTGGATSLESAADVVDDASSESSSDTEDEETEHQGKALNISATMGQANRKKIGLSDEDLGINVLIRRKGIYDYDVRGKKGREKMFPIAIRRRRTDDFGELIRPEDFLRAEERDEVDGQDMQLLDKVDAKDTLGKKRKWDDVATTTDHRLSSGGGKRQLSDSGLEIGSPSQNESALMDDDDYDPEELAEDEIVGPSRVEFSSETLAVNLRLAVVDFAGLHDKRSLHLLIPLIQPRKLILVSGLKDETLALASDCRKLLAAHTGSAEEKGLDVYTPEIGVSVNASVDTNAWVVKLTDTLVKRLRWQNVRGLGIVTLTGRLESPRPEIDASAAAEGANKRLKMLNGETEETPTREVLDAAHSHVEMPVLDILPSSMAAATRSLAQPLHVGDMRLADLRKIMQASGHTAEFRGEGVLLIDSSVIVRKSGTGRIEVESIGFGAGTMMMNQNQKASFYAVKAKIYEGLAVVAGG